MSLRNILIYCRNVVKKTSRNMFELVKVYQINNIDNIFNVDEEMIRRGFNFSNTEKITVLFISLFELYAYNGISNFIFVNRYELHV